MRRQALDQPSQVPVLLFKVHTVVKYSPGTVDSVDSRVVAVAATPKVCSVVCSPTSNFVLAPIIKNTS